MRPGSVIVDLAAANGGNCPLTVPDEVSARRMSRRELDRFEQAGDQFHRRVQDGFATMAAADPDRWVVVDATGPVDEVSAAIRAEVRERLGV